MRPRRAAAAVAKAHLLTTSHPESHADDTNAIKPKTKTTTKRDDESFVASDESTFDEETFIVSSAEEEIIPKRSKARALFRSKAPVSSNPQSKGPKASLKEIPVGYPRIRGRPRKDVETQQSVKSRLVEAKAHPLDFWIGCTRNATRVKRATKLGREKAAILMRPPVDLTVVSDLLGPSIPFDTNRTRLVLEALQDSLCFEPGPLKSPPMERLNIAFNSHNLGLDPLSSSLLQGEAVSFLYAGLGGISALDFGPDGSELVALSALPEPGYLDRWTQRVEGHTPIQIWKQQGINVAPFALIQHSFGLVRGLWFCPVSPSSTKFILMALFSDGVARLLVVDASQSGNFSLEAPIEIDLEQGLITTAQWTLDGSRVAVGSREGHVMLWSFETCSPGQVRSVCVASTRVARAPIISFAFHDGDPSLLAVGLQDSPGILVDWRKPTFPLVLYSPLANVPRVCWSAAHDTWLFADSESSVRGLAHRDLANRHTFAAGTFSGPVLDMAVSSLHNIVAMAGADGAVHLVWLDGINGAILAEQHILEMETQVDLSRVSYHSSVKIPELVAKTAARPLPSLKTSIPLLQWSRSKGSPGVLAIACAALGVVCFVAVDRLVLLNSAEM